MHDRTISVRAPQKNLYLRVIISSVSKILAMNEFLNVIKHLKSFNPHLTATNKHVEASPDTEGECFNKKQIRGTWPKFLHFV